MRDGSTVESHKTDGDGVLEPEPTISSRKRRWQAWLVVLFATVAVVAILFALRTPNLTPGQIVDQSGQYHSPNGRFYLEITETTEGNIRLSQLESTRRFSIIPSTTEIRVFEIESERGWFVCFDKYDRLWVYEGKWNPRWDKIRESFGVSPHSPVVSQHGFVYLSGRAVRGSSVVSIAGDWAGVPPEFFDRIPDKWSRKWGDIPPIPTSAPPLTPQQEGMAKSFILRR